MQAYEITAINNDTLGEFTIICIPSGKYGHTWFVSRGHGYLKRVQNNQMFEGMNVDKISIDSWAYSSSPINTPEDLEAELEKGIKYNY